jgi:SSS family solute:Na+ symporter
MPAFFADVLPVGCGGLILVSFLCDALQTLSSGVNGIAAAIGGDTKAERPQTGRLGLFRARLTTLAVGIVATALAAAAASIALSAGRTIFDLLPRMYNLFLGPLAALFLTGMFFRRATARVAIIVVATTLVFSVAWSWWSEVPLLLRFLGLDAAAESWTSILGTDADGRPLSPTIYLAIAAPAAFGLAFGFVASALFGRNDHPGVAYTRGHVLRSVPPEPSTS